MAFRFGPFGPSSLGTFTSQNTEGLGFPNRQVMFNLPRFQAPGMTFNAGGNFSGGGGGVGGLKFSITRQASSDAVQNILNDVINPLSGSEINIGGGDSGGSAPKRPRLRDMLTTNAGNIGPGVGGLPGFAAPQSFLGFGHPDPRGGGGAGPAPWPSYMGLQPAQDIAPWLRQALLGGYGFF